MDKIREMGIEFGFEGEELTQFVKDIQADIFAFTLRNIPALI